LNKLRIAILSDWYLPGTNAGGPVRSIHSLVTMLKHQCDFTIITRNHDLGQTNVYKEVLSDQLFEHEGVGYYYFSDKRLHKSHMVGLLKSLNVDLIYINSFWSFPFGLQIIQMQVAIGKPILLAPRGMLGAGAMGIKSFKKKLVLKILKWSASLSKVNFHATNTQEQRDILVHFPKAQVFNVSNVNYSREILLPKVKEVNRLRLYYLSRVSPVKNLHFALECLSHIKSDYEVVYDIYGVLEDTEYWQMCERIIKSLPPHVRINYKGALQFDEVQNVIAAYHALLLPTTNENFGHSIVESLFSGCPVIISDQTPWHQLAEHQAGFDLSLKDTQGFINAIETLAAANQSTYQGMAQAAIHYIREATNHQRTASLYIDMFYGAAKN